MHEPDSRHGDRRTAQRRLDDRREKRGRRPVMADPQKIGVFLEGELYDRVARYAIRNHKTNIAAAVRALLEAGLNSDCKLPQTLG